MEKPISTLAFVLLVGYAGAPQAAALSAPAMYTDAVAKERAVRQALATAPDPAAILKAVRTVVAAYELLVRHYPTSGYCDDALWNAAQLSIEAGRRFGDPAQTLVAVRLLKRLGAEYPSSRFARETPALLEALNRSGRLIDRPAGEVQRAIALDGPMRSAAPAPAAPVTATAAVPVPITADAPVAAPTATVGTVRAAPMLTAITRVVLPDVVRVTLDLGSEVLFRQEELSGPPRVFFDLPGAGVSSDLADRTLRFDSQPDIIGQIRVGRPSRDVLRVVLDSTGAAACSAVPLYSPYRLVIDCVRSAGRSLTGDLPSSRPVPRTPASLARKAPAAPTVSIKSPPPSATVVDRASAHAESVQAVTRGAPLVPAAPLAARATVAPMALPALLFARTMAPLSGSPLPAARRRFAPAELAAAAAEVTAPTAALVSAPNVPAAAVGRPAVAPAAPARNLDGGFSMARQLGLRVSRIVIDPGHGGHDPGAQGIGVSEASLVLDIALRLEKLLQERPGVEVILTRRSDEFVPLEERTAIANRESADLFLSIHANASSAAQAGGIETYFLNFAATARDAAVAARENAASGQPMSALPDFVKAIALNNKVDESRDFATEVQRALVQKLRGPSQPVRDLGVKQAPFVVLIGASMPSVLAEVSFVTNQREARLLKGQSYRQRIAEALFAAVQKYQASLTRVANVAQQH